MGYHVAKAAVGNSRTNHCRGKRKKNDRGYYFGNSLSRKHFIAHVTIFPRNEAETDKNLNIPQHINDYCGRKVRNNAVKRD